MSKSLRRLLSVLFCTGLRYLELEYQVTGEKSPVPCVQDNHTAVFQVIHPTRDMAPISISPFYERLRAMNVTCDPVQPSRTPKPSFHASEWRQATGPAPASYDACDGQKHPAQSGHGTDKGFLGEACICGFDETLPTNLKPTRKVGRKSIPRQGGVRPIIACLDHSCAENINTMNLEYGYYC
jgi:hypothetical protein